MAPLPAAYVPHFMMPGRSKAISVNDRGLKTGSTKGYARFWALSFLLAGVALAVEIAADSIALRSVVWGVGIFLAGLNLAFLRDGRFDMFEPRFHAGMIFSVFYGLGAIFPFVGNQDGSFSEDVDRAIGFYPQAAMVSFFCVLGFAFGYSAPLAIQWGRRSGVFQWSASRPSAALLWIVLSITGLASYAVLVANSAYLQISTVAQSPLFLSATGFFLNGVTAAIAIAVTLALRTRSGLWRAAATLTIVLRVGLGILTGSKTQAFVGFIIAGLAWNYAAWQFTRKQAAIVLVLTVALLLLMMPFNLRYRDALSEAGLETQSLGVALTQAKTALSLVGETDAESLWSSLVDYASARLSNMVIVANILRYQHEGGELHYGSSYARMLLVFVPRFLWPDKPPATISGAFNVEVFDAQPDRTVLGEETTITAVGITLVGEQVYNFSAYFAPFGIILVGMFFRWLYEAFKSGLHSSPTIAIALYSIWWMILIFQSYESNWASSFNGALTYSAFMVVLFVILRIQKKNRIASAGAFPI